jgi:hypothetical protein
VIVMSLGTWVSLIVLAAALLFIEAVRAYAQARASRIRRRKGI